MVDALSSAKYLAIQYKKRYDETITEMQLHKLLYFAQRESLVRTNEPLFSDTFEGWRFGPVIPSIRKEFDNIVHAASVRVDSISKRVLDDTFKRYGGKSSWSLSRLSHGEYSWQQARKGVSEFENSNGKILLDDIRVDANRIRERRQVLAALDD